jgi:hypothetical protein
MIILVITAVVLYVQSNNAESQKDTNSASQTDTDTSTSTNQMSDYQQCIQSAHDDQQYTLDAGAAASKENADVNACKAEYGM